MNEPKDKNEAAEAAAQSVRYARALQAAGAWRDLHPARQGAVMLVLATWARAFEEYEGAESVPEIEATKAETEHVVTLAVHTLRGVPGLLGALSNVVNDRARLIEENEQRGFVVDRLNEALTKTEAQLEAVTKVAEEHVATVLQLHREKAAQYERIRALESAADRGDDSDEARARMSRAVAAEGDRAQVIEERDSARRTAAALAEACERREREVVALNSEIVSLRRRLSELEERVGGTELA